MDESSLETWRKLMERGTYFLGQAEYSQAEKYFMQSIMFAKDLLVPEILAFTLRLLSTVRVKQGKLLSAERGFREALQICKELQNKKGMAEALAGLASVLAAQGQLVEAAAYYNLAIEKYPGSSPPLRLGMLYSDLGQVYSALEDWRRAKEAYIQAKDLCRIHGYPKGEGELSVLLGEVCFREGRKKEAVDWIISASRVFIQVPDENALAYALQYLAFIYFDINKPFEALDCQLRVMVLLLRQGQEDEVSEGYYFLSKILQSIGEFEEAEYYLEISVAKYERQDTAIALRYQNLAKLALTRLDLSKAEEYYLKALELFEKFEDDLNSGEIYEALAYIAESQGKVDEAFCLRQKSATTLSRHGALTFNAAIKLGEYYEARYDYLEALQYYWQALQIAKEVDLEIERTERAIQRVSRRIRRKNK